MEKEFNNQFNMQLFLVLELSDIILEYPIGVTSKLDDCYVIFSTQICIAL